MPVPVSGQYQRGPSCWDRVKMGFTLGFCVGLASGALFGGFSALRSSDNREVSEEHIRHITFYEFKKWEKCYRNYAKHSKGVWQSHSECEEVLKMAQ
ncbi:uncharacterized protein LOC143237532 isoform X2 [Tachypleus tridentatus]